ncbi:DUF397 domain-containing protein [Nocardia sp. NPDC051052]|uniref:DUF397 domain-containing protein n=1 Tax=Nocardia sp. NPDC051052 TaxID=3364322 RepID=UPI0037917963
MTVPLTGACWIKSSRSEGANECVEVAFLDNGLIGVRDSKDPNGSALLFTHGDWDAFTARVLDGQFNRPHS